MSTIISLVCFALFIGLFGSQLFLLWRHPYLAPKNEKPSLKDWWQVQHHARLALTTDKQARRLNGLFVLSQTGLWLGITSLILSFYLVEDKLNLLLVPTAAVHWATIGLVVGLALMFVYPLIWPTQSYRYWADHQHQAKTFTVADGNGFQRYRRHQLWAMVGGDGLLATIWLTRVWATSTEPLVVIENLLLVLITAMPIIALITALSQLPYLQHYHYLTAKPGKVNFGQLNYRATLALVKQQPTLKAKILTAHISRLIAYVLGIFAIGMLYFDIVAPTFTADPTAVFPAAIIALVALCILETVGAIWPPKVYDYFHLLDTTKEPFTVNDPDRFDQFRYHLYHYHLSAAIVWLFIWVAIIGAYYYYI
ncbi:hypothetical protein [Lactobacillus sp. CBA3605] [Lactiplantibacillus mudanjiangensis]|uniref:hypothetical protein n=1 Tax=Lactiplantibacillus mudanjiangensis TaxID=1296538 RepID=UPI0010140869|nr:hypothetical protein [Lactobacillus sp. CBA3605] [Lactiplantibacillus mudanjiangensis]